MSGKLASLMADLGDPSKYVRRASVDLFDEHDESYWADDKGRVVEKGTPGAKKKARRFGEAELLKIAAKCNARDARTGALAPLTLGHTIPDEPDETKQPEPVGYAANYKVAYDPDRGAHVLKADFYIRKERFDEAKTYPRTSIELWPDSMEVDPVALLRRTPGRSVQWYHSRGGRAVLRYSMEQSMFDEHDAPSAPPAAEPGHEERVERFMRHCYSHPDAGHFAKHYAMPEALAEPAPELPPADPTEFPSADEEPPGQHAAFPSATNAGLATPPEDKPGGKAKQYRKDAERIQYAKLEREVAELRQYAKEQREAAAEAEARRIVGQLVGEGYELDAAEEVPAFMALDAAGRDKRAAHVRRFYRQAPIASLGRVPLLPDAGGRKRGDDGPSAEEHSRALHYIRTHQGASYDEALARTKQG